MGFAPLSYYENFLFKLMNNLALSATIFGATSFGSYYYTQTMDKVSDDDWLAMPDGKLYHKSCIHYHDDEF